MSATFWNKRRRERALKRQLESQQANKIDEPKAEEKQTTTKKNGKSGK